ncbi:MAG: HAMP domain-containing histidine kinase [Bacteroidetes bacterium]|nr:HAMP domain-containing histidine kinase [Bacteroidota bacterium]
MLSQNRKSEFYNLMKQKAKTHAELLFETQQIDSALLSTIDEKYRNPLSSENITMYNVDGKIIYSNNSAVEYPITTSILNEIKLKGELQLEKSPYRILGITFKGKYDDAIIIAGDIDWASITKNNYLFRLLSSLYLISIIIVMFAGRLFAQRALNPLSKVITQVNNMPIESLETRLTVVNARDEIGQLAITFNMLLDKIQNSLKLQKIFLSAASHEMKNPLTSITSQLQVLQLKARPTEEYQQTIDSVLEDLTHLNKTTNDLIEFSRLSYEMNVGVAFEPVRIDDIIWDCKEYYAKVNPSSNVKIKFANLPENQDDLIIHANIGLLKIAFLNIIDNGCKFSANHTVTIQLMAHPTTMEVSFADQGIGMSESEREHIFEPFYRTNNTSGINGHGLGLAIVSKIMKFHKAQIQIESMQNVGTTFFFHFPRQF